MAAGANQGPVGDVEEDASQLIFPKGNAKINQSVDSLKDFSVFFLFSLT